MNYILSILLFLGAVSAQDVLVELYGQCGGLSYYGQWQCVPGSTCTAAGTNAFPGYQCYPNVGPIVPHCFPYAQCGGQGYVGPTLCPPGWTCVASNQYFSNCVADANTTTPADPTPDLAGPGNFCGESAVERSSPTDCVPGFACSGPGVYGYYISVADKEILFGYHEHVKEEAMSAPDSQGY